MPIIKFDGWRTPGKEPGTLTHRLTTYAVGADAITSGISHFEPGASVPLHFHNCEEQVTVVQGRATAIIDGVEHAVGTFDTSYVPAGVPHCFRNDGDEPFVMLFVYPAPYVERHFPETGEMDWHGRPPSSTDTTHHEHLDQATQSGPLVASPHPRGNP